MRIGADVKFVDGVSRLGGGPFSTVSALGELGFEGVLVRTMDEAFPTLDPDAVARFARFADQSGFFVRMGIGKVNPYMTAELPRVRRLGDGSYLAGMERMIRLCGVHGWREVWTAVGGYKPGLPAPFCFDRFRTDVTWQAQLEETERFIDVLAPTLRAEGVRLNIETHEEITTRELLRLVDAAGEDIVGVCLDPANIPVRGEAVIPAVARVAEHTRLTHLRDMILVRTENGISRFLAPLGDGRIDWPELLSFFDGRDDVDLLIEAVGGTRAEMMLQPDDLFWRAADPDLDYAEVAQLEGLADREAALIATGEALDVAALRAPRDVIPDYLDFLSRSRAALLLYTTLSADRADAAVNG